jgi:hypothetical protein
MNSPSSTVLFIARTREQDHRPAISGLYTKVINMTRSYLVLVIAMFSTAWMTIGSSAQTGFQDMEVFCSRHPTHPACSVIMDQLCRESPNDTACTSDDNDDDGDP